MYDFETLVGELLRNRPELSRDELDRRIAQKRETVGAGYLTDQGALFLVAGELGVSLQQASMSSDMTIKDLYIGANDVTVVARILAIYPVSTYKKKKEDGTGKYRRLVLFDGRQSVRLTAWEDQADEVAESGLAIDTPVRIVNAYIKQGLDGKPNLNLGRQGRIEVLTEPKAVSRLDPLSRVTDKLTKVSQEQQFVAVQLIVNTDTRYSEFVRSDGSPGSLFQFGALGEGGKDETRVVIWSPSEQPSLKPGQRVTVTCLRSRRTANGDFELHGDAGSTFIMTGKKDPMELRVASVTDGPNGKTMLAMNSERKIVAVELGRDVVAPSAGDAVLISSDTEKDGRVVCSAPDSLRISQRSLLPELGKLITKLSDTKLGGGEIMVEVIALSHGSADDVRLRDGSTVKLGELMVGDGTGEIRLVGWRDSSAKIPGIQPGERLRVVGAVPKQNKQGNWTLEISARTTIEKLKEAA